MPVWPYPAVGGPRGDLHAGPDPAPFVPHLDQRTDEAAEADAHHLREVPRIAGLLGG